MKRQLDRGHRRQTLSPGRVGSEKKFGRGRNDEFVKVITVRTRVRLLCVRLMTAGNCFTPVSVRNSMTEAQPGHSHLKAEDRKDGGQRSHPDSE